MDDYFQCCIILFEVMLRSLREQMIEKNVSKGKEFDLEIKVITFAGRSADKLSSM